MASPHFARDIRKNESTAIEEIDRLVDQLHDNADGWIRVSLKQRVALLERCIQTALDISEEWVRADCRAKGLDFNEARAGEEWLAGPVTTIRNIRLLKEALEAEGTPEPPGVGRGPGGRVVAKVFPTSGWESLLFTGFSAELWVEPGKPGTQGKIYRQKAKGNFAPGKVSLVLGAGNMSAIGPMDALYKLFVEDEVVILKTNPVNAYLAPFWKQALRPLVDAGVLAIVRGGVKVGHHLVHHEKVDTIHMTGSDRTHDIIVWGTSEEEQARRKATGEQLVNKPISSELGAVTPVFVVPGRWSEAQLDFQARHVVGMITNNASYNCDSAKVIVVGKHWAQKTLFLSRVREHLKKAPSRAAYYPGSQARYDAFLEHYPEAEALGAREEGVVPWTLIKDVTPETGEYALTNEAFCGVIAVTELEANSSEHYLEILPEFANDVCWGTLSCAVLIDPKTEAANQDRFDDTIAALRYGGIGINCWPGVIFGIVTGSWGAFPGHPMDDIQSGRGVVHNTFLFDHPERTILRAPFTIAPTPAWFPDHKTVQELGRALCHFEAKPSFLKIPAILKAALRA